MAGTEPARPARRRNLGRRVAILAASLLALVGLAHVGTSLAKVPPPATLSKLLTTAPSAQGELFAARTVDASPRPRSLPGAEHPVVPDTVAWKGEEVGIEEFLATTHTRAFVVLRDGEVHEEWYADGWDADDTFSSWSVAKSMVSLLAGRAIADGDLSEGDRLVDVVPELAGGSGAYDEITIGDLLDMSSGVDVSENYREWWPFTGTARLFISTDLTGFLEGHREMAFEPGSRADYRSVDTQLLGTAVARARGENLATLLEHDLWVPMGAESSATWNLDRPGGVEKAFCCVNAAARDYARFGQLVLDGGRNGTEQVVPAQWIERIRGDGVEMGESRYSAQWWHWAGADDDFSALGVYGQYVFVDPDTSTVIVKLSDHGTEQDEDETFAALREIAAGVSPAG